jgi:hypothetical protein
VVSCGEHRRDIRKRCTTSIARASRIGQTQYVVYAHALFYGPFRFEVRSLDATSITFNYKETWLFGPTREVWRKVNVPPAHSLTCLKSARRQLTRRHSDLLHENWDGSRNQRQSRSQEQRHPRRPSHARQSERVRQSGPARHEVRGATSEAVCGVTQLGKNGYLGRLLARNYVAPDSEISVVSPDLTQRPACYPANNRPRAAATDGIIAAFFHECLNGATVPRWLAGAHDIPGCPPCRRG